MEYKDYYKTLGSRRRRRREDDQIGVPEARPQASSGRQQGLVGALQGDQRGPHGALRPGEAEALRHPRSGLGALRARPGRIRVPAPALRSRARTFASAGEGGGFSDFFRTIFGADGAGPRARRLQRGPVRRRRRSRRRRMGRRHHGPRRRRRSRRGDHPRGGLSGHPPDDRRSSSTSPARRAAAPGTSIASPARSVAARAGPRGAATSK